MDTKSHILQESLKLFLSKSFKDVTLSEILEKTGLSKGAFYYYFKSKEQLFLEIVDGFFSYMIVYDFEKYSKASLQQFYHDHIKDLRKAINKFTSDKARQKGHNALNINYLYPIFDGLRILPEYKEKIQAARRKEIEGWVGAVDRARKSGEIRSIMTNEQIALIFIYTGNSIGLQLILENSPIESMAEIYLEFWDNFYVSLKA